MQPGRLPIEDQVAQPEAGIGDYDLAYFDASDLSRPAEDAVIQAGREVFAGGWRLQWPSLTVLPWP